MSLTLLVPDLLPAADAPAAMRALRLPALERLVARADSIRQPTRAADWLLARWGLPAGTPLAPITLAADAGRREGTWMRADPVHQRVDRDALVLHEAVVLDLTREECDEAVTALNAFLAGDGLAIEAPHPERWYLSLAPEEIPDTVPLAEAVGRNPFGLLPSGGVRHKWRSLFSEAQMLLAALSFNQAREAQGRPTLNGLWFWGAGALPAVTSQPFTRVAALDPLARGLAVASGTPVHATPPTLAGMAAEFPGTLVVIDALTRPMQRGDADAWCRAALDLERDWFAPLARGLATIEPVRLLLPVGDELLLCDLLASQRWRLWRRPGPLADHA